MALNITIHKNIMIKILKDIYSDTTIGPILAFKGGTAAYLFYELARFSVDLDFDLLDAEKEDYVFERIKNIVEKYGTLKEVNKIIHIQIEVPPNITISDAVGKLKAASSRYLRSKFKFIREIYLEKDGIWSVGYFSSTIGLNETQVRKYIKWQGRKDVPQKLRLFN